MAESNENLVKTEVQSSFGNAKVLSRDEKPAQKTNFQKRTFDNR
jgi:hypothetical protein